MESSTVIFNFKISHIFFGRYKVVEIDIVPSLSKNMSKLVNTGSAISQVT